MRNKQCIELKYVKVQDTKAACVRYPIFLPHLFGYRVPKPPSEIQKTGKGPKVLYIYICISICRYRYKTYICLFL